MEKSKLLDEFLVGATFLGFMIAFGFFCMDYPGSMLPTILFGCLATHLYIRKEREPQVRRQPGMGM